LRRGYERGGTKIPSEHEQLDELFAMIAKALAFQYFGVRLGSGSLLRKCDLPRCNRPVVYFRQETGYNGYRAATFLAV